MSTTHIMPPKGRVRVAALAQGAAASAIFATTQGKVDIAFVVVSPLNQVAAATPMVISFRHPTDTPVYFTVGIGGNGSSVIIPGFELPAGGMEAIVTAGAGGDEVDIDVFYYTANQS